MCEDMKPFFKNIEEIKECCKKNQEYLESIANSLKEIVTILKSLLSTVDSIKQ